MEVEDEDGEGEKRVPVMYLCSPFLFWMVSTLSSTVHPFSNFPWRTVIRGEGYEGSIAEVA